MPKQPCILIAAMAQNRVIGSNQSMPWNVPREYQHYLDSIRDHTVIMGRRTYAIFGEDLTSAHALVLSRSVQDVPGAEVVASVDEALRKAQAYERPIFCAGGASVYEQMLPHADRMYLSTIKGAFEGDAYFPAFDTDAWVVTREEVHPAYTFRIWDRVA